MKKAFTLVEMLVVVVVLVTLMGIAIRLGAIGTDSSHRNATISRMQRIENALSGYYAAFGSYPPVAVHGSRNIYLPVNGNGIQTEDSPKTDILNWNEIGEKEEVEAWEQVEAACRSQPFAARFPFSDDSEWSPIIEEISNGLVSYVEDHPDSVSEHRKQVLKSGFRNAKDVIGILKNAGGDETDWRLIEVFQYGVMSFLLPRYYFMCRSDIDFYRDFDQWKGVNKCPRNPFKRDENRDWNDIQHDARSEKARDKARILSVPSQAVCARWMPNFEGIVDSNYSELTVFGINIANKDNDSPNALSAENVNIRIYSPGGSKSSGGDQYVLDSLTILDGWGSEFFYYSESPYQSYTLWSSGPNRRTFPPWFPKDSLKSKELECVGKWIEDDIMRLSN